MLLRNRAPSLDAVPVTPAEGYEHLAGSSIAVMRWLTTSGVDFVLVGAVARSIRGDSATRGPVAIVPAPYGRNLDRLAHALSSARAQERRHRETVAGSQAPSGPLKLTADMLVRSTRWELRCGDHELDIEGRPHGAPSYQELLYEAIRFTVSPEVAIEVAAPEDIEYYDHVRRTGVAPEITVSRL
jgi:hypothetical protein